jgi:hypothetical protein
MSGKKGRPHKPLPLKSETVVALAHAVDNARILFGADAEMILSIPESERRESRCFDPNLVLIIALRRAWDTDMASRGIREMILGCDDAMLVRRWLEKSFSEVSVVAFNAHDTGFSDQLHRLQVLLPKIHITEQEKIADAYVLLSGILDCPPDSPNENESSSEQICKGILTPPFHREPSNEEIRSFLKWFEGIEVTREAIKNEAGVRGWKLSNSRRFPGSTRDLMQSSAT